MSHDLAQLNRHIARACAHIGDSPPVSEAKAIKGSEEGPPIHVISKPSEAVFGVTSHVPSLPHSTSGRAAEAIKCKEKGGRGK